MNVVIDTIGNLIGNLLFGLFSILFVLIDGLQAIFRSFAGIGNSYFGDFGNQNRFDVNIGSGNTGATEDTGIIYYLLQTEIIRNLFISILLLGLVLLIVFTVMAFIKNAYASSPKTWQVIIGNAFKGLANFVLVPVCCLLGVWLGNILLNAIDGATNPTGSTSMAGKVFVASAYNANEVRQNYVEGYADIDEGEVINLNTTEYLEFVYDIQNLYNQVNEKGANMTFDAARAKTDPSYLADKIDEIFASGRVSLYKAGNVNRFYYLLDVNYIVLVVAGLLVAYVLLSLVYAMIRRIIIILMLFVVSPGLCAMYPLDEGKAVGQWKGEFIKQVLSVYGAVAGMNIFLSILPLIQNISVSAGDGASNITTTALHLLNTLGITELIVVICGLLIMKEFISMISGYIGGEDAYSKGTSMRSSVKGTKDLVKKQGEKAGKKIQEVGAFRRRYAMADDKKEFWKDERKTSGQSFIKGLTGIDMKEISKGLKEDESKFRDKKETKAYISDLLKETDEDTGDLIHDLKTSNGRSEFMNRAYGAGVSKEEIFKAIAKAYKGDEEHLPNSIKVEEEYKQYQNKKAKAEHKEQVDYQINKQQEAENRRELARQNIATVDSHMININANKLEVKAADAEVTSTKQKQDEAKANLENFVNTEKPAGSLDPFQQGNLDTILNQLQQIITDGHGSIDQSTMSPLNDSLKAFVENANKYTDELNKSADDVQRATTRQITAQDDLSKSIDSMVNDVKAFAADIDGASDAVNEFETTNKKSADKVEDFGKAIQDAIKKDLKPKP